MGDSRKPDLPSRAAIRVGLNGIEISQSTVDSVGRFLASIVGEPAEHVMGFVTDWLRVRRAENAIKVLQAAQARLRERGISAPSRVLPLKLAHPLIEAASLEEDETLQALWANLLANSIDAGSGVEMTRSYIEVLRVLTPLEARILGAVYSEAPRPLPRGGKLFFAAGLPHHVEPVPPNWTGEGQPPVENAVILALSNLGRLGCLQSGTTWDGGEHFGHVVTTEFGAALVEACSHPPSLRQPT